MSEVTKEMIDGWKTKYGRVAKLTLGGIEWFYRPIDLDEYYSIQTIPLVCVLEVSYLALPSPRQQLLSQLTQNIILNGKLPLVHQLVIKFG